MYITVSEKLAEIIGVSNPIEVHDISDIGYEIKDIGYEIKDNNVDKLTILSGLVTGIKSDEQVSTGHSDEITEVCDTNTLSTKMQFAVNPTKSSLNKLTIKHSTHYIKLTLDEELSLRKFVNFQDRPGMVHQDKWRLWNHKTKEVMAVSQKIVLTLLPTVIRADEIIGRKIGNKYQKLVTNLSTGVLTVQE